MYTAPGPAGDPGRPPLIIVALQGGIGNQMFQYAAGRCLSETTSRRLLLDASRLRSGSPSNRRNFCLSEFPIPQRVTVASRGLSAARQPSELERIFWSTGHRLGLRILRPWVIQEADTESLTQIQRQGKHLSYLVGYWQSPNYFKSCSLLIRKELTPKIPEGTRLFELRRILDSKETIGIHVRRGDYADVSQAKALHGLLGTEYYEAALNRILNNVRTEATVVLFSDDPDWAETTLHFPLPTVVIRRSLGITDVQTLALMAKCRNHIIANSTFSWWGAWLADHDEQHVIYPSPWFANRASSNSFRFPEDWVSVPRGAPLESDGP